jgi:oxalate decarboxylase
MHELHWHVEAEWAIMLYGNAGITAVDQHGRSFVSDVSQGDVWLFPNGIPHSIQGLGPDGCRFLLAFDDSDFDEFHTFLITDWLAHTPNEVLAKNFSVPESTFNHVPKKELFIFQTVLLGDLKQEQDQAAAGTGLVPKSFDFKASTRKPTKVTRGGEVKIIDSKIFSVTPISAAIVTLNRVACANCTGIRMPTSGSTTSLVRAGWHFLLQVRLDGPWILKRATWDMF